MASVGPPASGKRDFCDPWQSLKVYEFRDGEAIQDHTHTHTNDRNFLYSQTHLLLPSTQSLQDLVLDLERKWSNI